MKYLITLFISTLLLYSCTKDFSAINTNENAPTEVVPALLLRQVLYGFGNDMSYEGFVAGSLLSQHFSMTDFNLFDRHALASPQEGGNPWDILYLYLRDNENMLQIARENPAQAVYEGPALVLKAYFSGMLTDLFGDVPYSEAVSGRIGIVNPVYDTQEAIYTAEQGLFALLDEAVTVMEAYNGSLPLAGDILFEGDLTAWIRFAHSLRIKYLLRASDRINVSASLQAIYNEGNYLQENSQNATFQFSDALPNNYPIATVRVGIFNVFVMSARAQSLFADLNDPRLAVFYRPSGNGQLFQGLVNGINAAATAITVDDYARPGRIFREEAGRMRYNYLTAWETHFFLAEAALKGYIEADAQALYERAVALAFDYWQTPLPADYLGQGPAAFLPERGLEQLMTQKWIAHIGNSYEAWIEWRRTGFPALLPVAASLNDGLLPVRLPYPNDEQALNFENYQAAAARTQGNSINAKVWWDQ